MHSVKEDCKAKVQNDSRPARYIINHFENAKNFFQRETDSVVPRNSRQIYNYQKIVSKNKTKDDDVLDIIVEMLNQAKDSSKFSFLSRPWPTIYLWVWVFLSVWKASHICALFRPEFQRYNPILYRHLPILSIAFSIWYYVQYWGIQIYANNL